MIRKKTLCILVFSLLAGLSLDAGGNGNVGSNQNFIFSSVFYESSLGCSKASFTAAPPWSNGSTQSDFQPPPKHLATIFSKFLCNISDVFASNRAFVRLIEDAKSQRHAEIVDGLKLHEISNLHAEGISSVGPEEKLIFRTGLESVIHGYSKWSVAPVPPWGIGTTQSHFQPPPKHSATVFSKFLCNISDLFASNRAFVRLIEDAKDQKHTEIVDGLKLHEISNLDAEGISSVGSDEKLIFRTELEGLIHGYSKWIVAPAPPWGIRTTQCHFQSSPKYSATIFSKFLCSVLEVFAGNISDSPLFHSISDECTAELIKEGFLAVSKTVHFKEEGTVGQPEFKNEQVCLSDDILDEKRPANWTSATEVEEKIIKVEDFQYKAFVDSDVVFSSYESQRSNSLNVEEDLPSIEFLAAIGGESACYPLRYSCHVDLLYWRTYQSGSSSISNPDNSKWNAGYRIEIQSMITRYCNIGASWTHFQSSLNQDSQTNLSKLRYDALDLLLGSSYLVNPCLILKPALGLRYVHIQQHVDYHDENEEACPLGTCPVSIDFNQNVNFNGVGPQFSLMGEWDFGCGVHFLASLGGSVLYGHFNNKESLIEVFENPYEIYTCQGHSRDNVCLGVIDAVLGVQWNTRIFGSRPLAVRLAWEHHGYLRFLRDCGNGDLSFDGVSCSAGISF